MSAAVAPTKTGSDTEVRVGAGWSATAVPRWVAYVGVVLSFGAAYGTLVFVVSEYWGVRTFAGSVRIFAVGFLVSLSAGIPLYVRLQGVMDRWFAVRGDTSQLTLRKFLAELTLGGDVGVLVHRALEAVRTDLGLSRAALFLLSPDELEFTLTAARGTAPEQRTLPATHPLIQMLAILHTEISRRAVETQPRYANVRTACVTAFKQLGADLLLPIEVDGRLLGFLVFGVPHGARAPADTDLDLLRALASEIGVSLARGRDAERLREARVELERYTGFLSPTVGREVLRGTLPGERGRRRPVTVVTCDLVGFGALVEAESDTLGQALERYHAIVAEEIRREGGTFAFAHRAQVTAVFGDPEPYPDHARRALRMAVRAAPRAREVWMPWRRHVPELDVRIAIATGPAVVGFMPIGTAVSYNVVGGLKRRSESLLESAPGGAILSAAETLVAAGDGVESRPIVDETAAAGAATAYHIIAVSDAESAPA